MLRVGSARQPRALGFPLAVLLLGVLVRESSGTRTDCVRATGEDYRGTQQSSSSGVPCLTWTNTTRDYDVTVHPDSLTGAGGHTFCRNPDAAARPWCYVVGPDGAVQRQFCTIPQCTEQTAAAQSATSSTSSTSSTSTTSSTSSTQRSTPIRSGGGAVMGDKSMMGISQRVHTSPKKKKDLGPVGYVLGILMMALIIVLGVGITVGYFYKRGRDLKKQHEQRVQERELQRISLPLSAFSNPTCDLDENTIVVLAEQDTTPLQEGAEGGAPLMGAQAGTPGA